MNEIQISHFFVEINNSDKYKNNLIKYYINNDGIITFEDFINFLYDLINNDIDFISESL